MSNKQKAIVSDLVCLECGNVNTIYRKESVQKPVSNIKYTWCYKCKKETRHYEVKDIDKFMTKYTESEEKMQIKELVENAKGRHR